ncbi:MAG: radical SAM protein [Proteobacteria bacterium]|nr:radical SAM protein [Pseudomonadota bacterium]
MKSYPSYFSLAENGELKHRVEKAYELLKSCRLCPRKCGKNRTKGEKGFCKTGLQAVVSSHGPHFGEERPLSGRHGSGTIFFTYCNLGCVFCQNYEISHLGMGEMVTPEKLAAEGFSLPLVYNCGGYESMETLKLLDGIVDIYMPDFKFWDEKTSERLASAPDYPQVAREAIREMYRQVGDLTTNGAEIAKRGILVRHLVLPSGLAGTGRVAGFLSREISSNTYVNVMDQYRPCYRADRYPEISRPLREREFADAVELAVNAGLCRLDQVEFPRYRMVHL